MRVYTHLILQLSAGISHRVEVNLDLYSVSWREEINDSYFKIKFKGGLRTYWSVMRLISSPLEFVYEVLLLIFRESKIEPQERFTSNAELVL